MYVKAYLDQCSKSLDVVAVCFLARVPGSLAGGFLVTVAGRALVVFFACF